MWQTYLNYHQRMGILPLKKRVNRNKCSFATKLRMFVVFAIDEILCYRWAPFAGSRTLCHPCLFYNSFFAPPSKSSHCTLWTYLDLCDNQHGGSLAASDHQCHPVLSWNTRLGKYYDALCTFPHYCSCVLFCYDMQRINGRCWTHFSTSVMLKSTKASH